MELQSRDQSAVVVLGSRLRSTSLHDELRGRVAIGIEVFQRQQADYLLFSGGYTNPKISLSEAEAMAEYATDNGVSCEDILIEDQSMDTIGNGYWTRLVIDEVGGVSELFLVTSCFHRGRALLVFRHCFGPFCSVVSEDCYRSQRRSEAESEQVLIAETKELLEAVPSGDIQATARRIENESDLYDEMTVPDRYKNL